VPLVDEELRLKTYILLLADNKSNLVRAFMKKLASMNNASHPPLVFST
jgi:hypothetical protein